MNTPMCVLCKEPTSLCQCPPEVRAFGDAHILTHDGERALIDGDTLRVLIERAQAWGRMQSAKVVAPEAARTPDDGGITLGLVEIARYNAIEECARVCDLLAGLNVQGWGRKSTSAAQKCATEIRSLNGPDCLPQPQGRPE